MEVKSHVKDIDKGNYRPTVHGVSASTCFGKVREGEVLRGTRQKFREGSRGAEMLHQASTAEGWSPGCFWALQIQCPAGALPKSLAHLTRHTECCRDHSAALLGNPETAFPWTRLQTGLYHSVTLKQEQWAMILMSEPWSQ